jgi:hypothetical protein
MCIFFNLALIKGKCVMLVGDSFGYCNVQGSHRRAHAHTHKHTHTNTHTCAHTRKQLLH